MAQDLRLVLVTPEKTLLDEPVRELRFPLYDGQIGIRPGRAPLVGRLGIGELRVTTAGGQVVSYFIDGGFSQVKGRIVTLLTNRAVPTTALTRAEAAALLEKARNSQPKTEIEFEAKRRDEERGRKMLALASR